MSYNDTSVAIIEFGPKSRSRQGAVIATVMKEEEDMPKAPHKQEITGQELHNARKGERNNLAQKFKKALELINHYRKGEEMTKTEGSDHTHCYKS